MKNTCPFKSSLEESVYCLNDCALFGKEKCLIVEYLEYKTNPFGNLISYDLASPFNKKEPNNE